MEKLSDVRRIFLKLEEPLNLAYAIGALAGLRTGEVFALRWTSVDLAGRRILVSESIGGLTKDREPRPVSIQDALLPLLKAWHVKTGGTGLVIPPMRQDGAHIDKSTPAQHLRHALVALKLPPLEPKPWYQATRHTFASHWAMAGRPASYRPSSGTRASPTPSGTPISRPGSGRRAFTVRSTSTCRPAAG